MTQFRWIALLAGAMFGMYSCAAQIPTPPQALTARGFEAHVELRWQPSAGASGYQLFRSTDGGQQFSLLKTVGSSTQLALDWTADEGQSLNRQYRVKAVNAIGQTSDFSDIASAQTAPMADDALLDMVQEYTFRYFWDYGHPISGMARERNNGDPNIVTSGGSGFGIMALVVGAERGWVSREAAVDRMIRIVSFLQFADRYHGVFPHWMNGNTGKTVPFSQYDNGADLVESAFLIQGLLAARQYFDQNTPQENDLRQVITGLWEDVEWDWFRKNGGPSLYWHWSPNYGWQMNFQLRGFFEAQIVYILAAASPTHPVPGSLYQSGWTANGNYCTTSSLFGHRYYCGSYGGGPMFFAHYSYLGFDPRRWKDACCNYFTRNRNHALIQWEYAKNNIEKHIGYSAECWGLTACDGPNGYSAHDVQPANDDGTIAPTAALASMPYTPDQSLAALKYFYRTQGEKLWGIYGFYDAFNLDKNWVADSYLAIDQGPIVAMLENHRTGLLWDLFMRDSAIRPALLACGFVPDNSVVDVAAALPVGIDASVYPNPSQDGIFTLRLELEKPQVLSAVLTDQAGRRLRQVFAGRALPAGALEEKIDIGDLPQGVYFLQIKNIENQVLVKKVLSWKP
ncbi:MAG: T9SS type A sorting domain-containing protein [Saprospiraceae bacterium]|nr:T9SS type A sorting domain-containing protein [Saprospiraceae bacterium]